MMSLVPTATATPVPTVEPTSTPEPVDEDLVKIHNFPVGDKLFIDVIGGIPNAELTTTGELNITKKDGSVVTISKSDLASSMYYYNGVLQIREQSAQEEGRLVNASYVLDPETNTMLAVSDYLPGDIYEVDSFPKVNSVEEYREFFRQASLFLTEAPENTYRPGVDDRPAFSTLTERGTVVRDKTRFAYGVRPEGTVPPLSAIKDSFVVVYRGGEVPLIIDLVKIASFVPGERDVKLVAFWGYVGSNAMHPESIRAHEDSLPFHSVPLRELHLPSYKDLGSFDAVRKLYEELGITMYGQRIETVEINGEVFFVKDVLNEWKMTGKVSEVMQEIIWPQTLTRFGY